MLRYSDRAEAQLLAIHPAGGPHYLKLVRRLIELENDASTFEALRHPVVLDTAVELHVWILALRHGQ